MHCDCDPIFTHSTIGTLQIEEHIKVINGTLQCDSQPYPKSIPTAFTDPPLDQSYNFTTFFDSKCTQPAEPFFPKTGGCLNLNGERPNPLEAGSFLKNPGYGIWQYSELDCSGKTLSRGTIPSVGSCFAFDDAAVSFELVGSWYPN